MNPTQDQADRIERNANAGLPDYMPRVWARIIGTELFIGLEGCPEITPAALTWDQAESLVESFRNSADSLAQNAAVFRLREIANSEMLFQCLSSPVAGRLP